MAVAVLQLQIHLPYAESLKDRRMVVRSLKDRLRRRFNVSVAELDGGHQWQWAVVGMVAISSDRAYLQGLLERAGDEALSILCGQEVSLGDIEFLD